MFKAELCPHARRAVGEDRLGVWGLPRPPEALGVEQNSVVNSEHPEPQSSNIFLRLQMCHLWEYCKINDADWVY